MAKMTECKSCTKEIAKSAKTCPHCGAKNKGGGILKWIGIIFLVLIVINVAFRGGDNDGVETSSGTGTSQLKTISINDSITWKDLEIRISNYKAARSFSDGQFIEADAQPGAILVAAVVDYKNVGSKPVNPFSLPTLELVSPENVTYEQDLGKGAFGAVIFDIDQKVVSEINPGLRSQDVFVFEISEELWNQGGWHFEYSSIRNVQVTVQ